MLAWILLPITKSGEALKTISGYKEPDSQVRGEHQWANDLNIFFNRFDQSCAPPSTHSPLLHPPLSPLPGNGPVTSPTSTQPPAISSQTLLTSTPGSSPPDDDTLSLTTCRCQQQEQSAPAPEGKAGGAQEDLVKSAGGGDIW
ncbi:hypothetical protein KUCAC02_030163 [Chaenocephalus aceratus]|uniref:Uncharacterized protein n=1 Tax=Chaenocephalus aceratus TaxID=36190 RepID=A0ACB9XKA9_CHAAC|nr:hypothetical protein KUCAC02_030163 [Chaenocephalus aceratus]